MCRQDIVLVSALMPTSVLGPAPELWLYYQSALLLLEPVVLEVAVLEVAVQEMDLDEPRGFQPSCAVPSHTVGRGRKGCWSPASA